MSFINWCNENQGFLSFVLSFLTFLTSIVAIIISLISIRLPYKKKINVEGACRIDIKTNKVHVYISNVGNKVISIKQISIIYQGVHIGGTGSFKEDERILKPSELKEFILNAHLTDKNIDDFIDNGQIIVEDTENKTFKSNRILPMI